MDPAMAGQPQGAPVPTDQAAPVHPDVAVARERVLGVVQQMDGRIQGLEQQISQEQAVRTARRDTIKQLLPPEMPAEPGGDPAGSGPPPQQAAA
jgi:hypothetical protein